MAGRREKRAWGRPGRTAGWVCDVGAGRVLLLRLVVTIRGLLLPPLPLQRKPLPFDIPCLGCATPKYNLLMVAAPSCRRCHACLGCGPKRICAAVGHAERGNETMSTRDTRAEDLGRRGGQARLKKPGGLSLPECVR